jgi:hypothetical protein
VNKNTDLPSLDGGFRFADNFIPVTYPYRRMILRWDYGVAVWAIQGSENYPPMCHSCVWSKVWIYIIPAKGMR